MSDTFHFGIYREYLQEAAMNRHWDILLHYIIETDDESTRRIMQIYLLTKPVYSNEN